MLKLVFAYLLARPWMTALNVLLVAVSVAMISLLVQVSSQIEAKLLRESKGIDLVVGGKGSPLQLVLAGVYHLDVPPGNIPVQSLETLRKNRFIAQAIPMSLGDSFRGFRIVGTEASILNLYQAKVNLGQWPSAPMQVLLGAKVAAQLNLALGSVFASTHGLADGGTVHEDQKMTVVGILASTDSVLDRLILTPLESVWLAHEGKPADDEEKKALEQAREITLALVRYASPIAAATVPRQINANNDMQAASPAFESARLLQVLGPALKALTWLAMGLLIMAGLSIFVALSQALADRRQELAMLRLLGASRARLFAMLCLEGLLLAAAGIGLGLLISHLGLTGVSSLLSPKGEWTLRAWQGHTLELALVLIGLALGLLAAAWPAWRATRTQTQDLLNEI